MAAEKSFGATLTKVKSGSEPTDTLIAGLTSIGAVGGESEEIDVTTLDSPDGYKEFIAGLKDSGSVPVEGFIKDESNVSALKALFEAQVLESWIVTFVSGSKWTFTAFVKSFKEAETKVDGARGFTAELRISGASEFVAAGASV